LVYAWARLVPKRLNAQQMTFEPVALRVPQYQDCTGKERRGYSQAFEGHRNKSDGEEDGDEHLSVLLPERSCEPWADPRRS
jgi:hypothetical protein